MATIFTLGFSKITPKVIYGEDNRLDVYQVSRADIRDVADSTVAIIPITSLKVKSGSIQIDGSSFGQDMGLCKDEPFFNQITAANCSGFLVGDDLIATAGHCVSSSDCKKYAFVFGFKMLNQTQVQDSIANSEVYNCKEIVAHEYTDEVDYALVRLDRPVRGHRVLKLQQNPADLGEEIYVVGHPSGLPTKVAQGASVREQNGQFFVANLDTYGGNSGSAVFNEKTSEVVGILVRGATDYIYDRGAKCTRSNQCPLDGCRGEDVTNISFIINALKQTK